MQNKKFKLKAHFGLVSAILIGVFAVLLAADLVLKYCEVKYDWNFTVIPKLIWVEAGCKNTGAAFSFLADTEWGRIFFIVLTFLMLIAMLGGFILLPERFVCLKTAIAMVAAGALGNLVDRLAFGYVRDFVWVNIFGSWACCNFADFWIVFGVILAIIDMLFLNEWAVFPLTKSAKAAAKVREQAERDKKDGNTAAVNVVVPQSEGNAEKAEGGETVEGGADNSADNAADGVNSADDGGEE